MYVALDPFRRYANAIHDGLPDAVAVLDAFSVVELATPDGGRAPRPRTTGPVGHRRHSGSAV